MDPTVENGDSHWSLVETIKQSPPVDVTQPYDTRTLAGKTILITGGASGLGAAFARAWATHGAHVIVGDRYDAVGAELVAELRRLPGSSGAHYFQHCNVTSWADQVALFRFAAASSPTGGIDAVVANAGIADKGNAIARKGFEGPRDLDAADASARPPDLQVIDVNVRGVLYTTHLALFWLPRNGGRSPIPGIHDPRDDRGLTPERVRDRHLLLVGSIAGLGPLPGNTLYSASKHAVTGLFRSLRGTIWAQGVRCNMICPYFVDTPILPRTAIALMAGGALAEIEDVVEAASRLMADESIVGRALVAGPKMQVVDGEEQEVNVANGSGKTAATRGSGAERTQAVWEAYAHDYTANEVFVRRYIGLLNNITKIRGWVGFWKDLWRLYVTGPKVVENVKNK